MTYPFREDVAKTRRKRRKLTPQQSAKRQCDRIFSLIIRSVGHCERCGRTGRLECSHWIGRTAANTRTDLDNAFAMCHACHRWWHADPIPAGAWAIAQRGQATYDRLNEARNLPSKMDWVAELIRLREIAKREGIAA